MKTLAEIINDGEEKELRKVLFDKLRSNTDFMLQRHLMGYFKPLILKHAKLLLDELEPALKEIVAGVDVQSILEREKDKCVADITRAFNESIQEKLRGEN